MTNVGMSLPPNGTMFAMAFTAQSTAAMVTVTGRRGIVDRSDMGVCLLSRGLRRGALAHGSAGAVTSITADRRLAVNGRGRRQTGRAGCANRLVVQLRTDSQIRPRRSA